MQQLSTGLCRRALCVSGRVLARAHACALDHMHTCAFVVPCLAWSSNTASLPWFTQAKISCAKSKKGSKGKTTATRPLFLGSCPAC